MHEKNKSRKEFHMKRIFTIALALVMLVSVLGLYACANNDDKNDTTTPDATVDPTGSKYNEKLNDLDFGGTEVRFVFAEGANDHFTQRSIKVEEEGGNDVNKQLMARNAYVENAINVKISSTQVGSGFGDLNGEISNSLAAGADAYDVLVGYQYYDIGWPVLNGYLVNLNRPETYDIVDYFNFDNDYWGKYYNENLLAGNGRYWVTGDIALRYIGGMYVTYVNERIYSNTLKEKYGDIYDIAFDGKWTLDMLTEMAELCYVDNGNDEVDKEDQLGFIWESNNDSTDGLAFGSQVPYSTKYADGSIKITLNSDRTIEFVNKLDKLFNNGKFSYCETAGDDSRVRMELFATGTVAFVLGQIKHAENWLGNMVDKYYVLPAPKLNEQQADYVTGVHDGCSIFGIAKDSSHIQAAAATLEIMAAKSHELVTPVYYESAVKFQYTRDSAAARVIEELVHKHVETDFAGVWSNQLGDVVHFFRNNNTTKGLTSTLKRSMTSYQTQLDTLLAKFAQLQEDEGY